MKKNYKELISGIIFFGGLWGLIEATLGYLLHLVPAYISGVILVPIGTYLLVRAYRQLGSRVALGAIGMIAALIKAINFLLPQVNFFKTLNPMIAILLEAVLAAVVITVFDKKSTLKVLGASMVVHIGWRGIFGLYLLIPIQMGLLKVPYLSTLPLSLDFFLVKGIVSSILFVVILKVDGWIRNQKEESISMKLSMNPISGMLMLVIAFSAQWLLG